MQELELLKDDIRRIAYLMGYGVELTTDDGSQLVVRLNHYLFQCQISLKKVNGVWVFTVHGEGKYIKPYDREKSTKYFPCVDVLSVVSMLLQYDLRFVQSAPKDFYRVIAKYLKDQQAKNITFQSIHEIFKLLTHSGFNNPSVTITNTENINVLIYMCETRTPIEENQNYLKDPRLQEELSLYVAGLKTCINRMSRLKKFMHLELDAVALKLVKVLFSPTSPPIDWLGSPDTFKSPWALSAVSQSLGEDAKDIVSAYSGYHGKHNANYQTLNELGLIASALAIKGKIAWGLIQGAVSKSLHSNYEMVFGQDKFVVNHAGIPFECRVDSAHRGCMWLRDIDGVCAAVAVMPIYIAEAALSTPIAVEVLFVKVDALGNCNSNEIRQAFSNAVNGLTRKDKKFIIKAVEDNKALDDSCSSAAWEKLLG